MTTLAPTPARGGRLRNAADDLSTMVGRSFRLTRRDPDELIMALVLPTSILVLFVYVFGGAISIGVDYITYATPGVILLCAGYGASNTAIAICQDMTSGAMDRFRSLPIVSATAVGGHIVVSVLKNLVTTAVVLAVAVAIGFRPSADPLEWLGAIGMVVAYVTAITCVAALIGVTVRSPAAAGGFGFVMLFLPYVSSAFVPPETMPTWMRGFAEHQPITPVIETLRGLLVGLGTDGQPVADLGSTAALALGWCALISIVFAGAAAWVFNRRRYA
ncbi:ABC transporter permease [Gordonia sp. PKS22-38]|uniref:Transport permease protein n=1 Tax=Gordonia prachuapensis TaxID=3115651 RepID=A0ABU7MXD8_9ACTN|nr:ABC transporter permease [Gordonia sp. PKS22-38]